MSYTAALVHQRPERRAGNASVISQQTQGKSQLLPLASKFSSSYGLGHYVTHTHTQQVRDWVFSGPEADHKSLFHARWTVAAFHHTSHHYSNVCFLSFSFFYFKITLFFKFPFLSVPVRSPAVQTGQLFIITLSQFRVNVRKSICRTGARGQMLLRRYGIRMCLDVWKERESEEEREKEKEVEKEGRERER